MDHNAYSDEEHQQDLKVLHSMGYAQELERRMGAFSNFAISFSIVCIIAGGVDNISQVTSGIGGAGIGIGWVIGALISATFALGMGQIASAYPTSGGLYHWGSILGNRFTGWLTAWLNLIGLITVLAAVNVGVWVFFVGSFGVAVGIDPDQNSWTFYYEQAAFVAVITVAQAIINHVGIGLTAKLTDFAGYLIMVTAAVLTVACLVYAPHWDFSRLWTFANYSGLPEGDGAVWPKSESLLYILGLGLLLPLYTITGYDASAHTSEETRNAGVSVPKSMVNAVIGGGVAGWIMLCAIIIALPNMDEAAQQGGNVFFWMIDTVLPHKLGLALYFCILVAQFLCGLATTTSASRMIFAFARDGGLPFSATLKHVSKSHRSPVAAIWTAAIAAIICTLYTSAYTTIVSATVISIFVSYAVPIGLGLFAYKRSWTVMGPWDLGIWFRPIAVLVLLGTALIIYVGIQPPNDKAAWILLAYLAIAALVWILFERRRFQGPPIGDVIAKRQQEIAEAEVAIGETVAENVAASA
jgi:amino acid transporter